MIQTEPETAPDVYDDGRLRVEHESFYIACEGQSIKLPRTEFLIINCVSKIMTFSVFNKCNCTWLASFFCK